MLDQATKRYPNILGMTRLDAAIRLRLAPLFLAKRCSVTVLTTKQRMT
jgi:hypothetical protein